MKFLLFSSSLLLATTLAAKGLRDAGEQLRVKKGLRVDFEQRVLTIRKKIRMTKGEGFFHPDGRFRWIIKHRGQMVRTYVYDRKTITEYLPAEKTANVWSITSAKTDAITRIVALIKAPHQLQRDYVVQEQPQGKHTLQLSLVPRKSSDISSIAVAIDLKANFIHKVKINYRNQRYSEFTFRNPQRKSLAAKHFNFAPPAGTKVNQLR